LYITRSLANNTTEPHSRTAKLPHSFVITLGIFFFLAGFFFSPRIDFSPKKKKSPRTSEFPARQRKANGENYIRLMLTITAHYPSFAVDLLTFGPEHFEVLAEISRHERERNKIKFCTKNFSLLLELAERVEMHLVSNVYEL
jgi:hypothetical protein